MNDQGTGFNLKEAFSKYRTQIYWFLAFALFCGIGYFLYTGFSIPDFNEIHPQYEGSMTIKELDRVIEGYSNAIHPISNYIIFWSFVAVLAGISATAAVALRAPHPIIIASGAFLALIFAAIELYSPDKVKSAIVKARAGIVCLKHSAVHLNEIENKYLETVDSLNASFSKESMNFEEEKIRFKYKLERFAVTELLHKSNFNHYQPELQKWLEKQVTDVTVIEYKLELFNSYISDAIEEIDDLRYEAGTEEGGSRITPEQSSEFDRLEEELHLITDKLESISAAISILNNPKSRIRSAIADYSKILEESEVLRLHASKYSSDLNFVIDNRKEATEYTANWRGELNKQYTTINNLTQSIHSNLLSTIARTEITAEKLAKVLEQIEDIVPGGGGDSDGAGKNSEIERITVTGSGIKRISLEYNNQAPETTKQLDIMVDEWLKSNSNVLVKLEEEAKVWDDFFKTSVEKVEDSNSDYDSLVSSFKYEIERDDKKLSPAVNSIKSVEQLRGAVNFDKINDKVIACGITST